MPRFAANLSMLYPELPFLDRFEAAARRLQGGGVPVSLRVCQGELVARLKANGLQQVLFNAPPGGTDAPPSTGPGTAATKASPACRGARPSSAPVCAGAGLCQALGCPRIH
jgi:hydroxypyruvate isomerase